MVERFLELPFGLPGRVYRSPMPYGAFAEPDLIEQYRQAGVQTVVMLTPDEEAQEKTGRNLRNLYREMGLEVLYMPIPDFSAPPIEPLRQAVNQAFEQARTGRNLVVHCNAGIGRTGLFLACLAQQALGLSAQQAIAWVRQFVEHAVEVPEQEAMVKHFLPPPV